MLLLVYVRVSFPDSYDLCKSLMIPAVIYPVVWQTVEVQILVV